MEELAMHFVTDVCGRYPLVWFWCLPLSFTSSLVTTVMSQLKDS